MLNNLYTSIYNYQNRTVNPLYAHLPTTFTIAMEDVSFSSVMSPKSSKIEEDWAHWAEVEDVDSDTDSDDSEDRDWLGGLSAVRGKKGVALDIQPWQTLLLLEDNAPENAEQMSQLLVGLGVSSGDQSATPGSSGFSFATTATSLANDARRGSGETILENDEGEYMKCLIQACDVTKP